MLQRQPTACDGFISVGQLVAGAENEVLSHRLALEQARRSSCGLTYRALLRDYPPYGPRVGALLRKCFYLYLLRGFFKCRRTGLALTARLFLSPYYSLWEKLVYLRRFRVSLEALQPTIESLDFLAEPMSVSVPVLFCVGRHDLVTPLILAERLYRHIDAPTKRLEVFEEEAHCLQYDNPQRFAQVVTDWLTAVTEPGVTIPHVDTGVSPGRARAHALVLRHGWNATVYQILNPGIRHWFSPTCEAVVGYVSHAGMRVVAGAPVAAPEDLEAVAQAFERDAANAGEKVCYFCAEARLEALYKGREGYAKVVLGGQPVWNPQAWGATVQANRSLRAQLNRARNKGVTVSRWASDKAQNHLELQALLESWLAAKRLPSLHFLVEPRTLSDLRDRRVFVAQQGERIVGFVVASPVPTRGGWLIEQVIRHRRAPNGTSELLIDAAARSVAADGSLYFTLGLVPLAERSLGEEKPPSRWLPWLLRWVRAHGRRFYNFSGLEYFKAKFCPHEWDAIYAITNEASFSPKALYAIAAAFSDGSPLGLLAGALGKAAKQELSWQWQRLSEQDE